MLCYDVHLRQRWQSTHHIRQTISLTHDCRHMPVPGPGTWLHAGVDPPDGWHGYEPRVRQIVIIFSAVWRPFLSMTRARPLIIVTSAVFCRQTEALGHDWQRVKKWLTKRVGMIDRGCNNGRQGCEHYFSLTLFKKRDRMQALWWAKQIFNSY